MKNLFLNLCLILILFLLLLTSACQNKNKTEIIKIGALVPITGSLASMSSGILTGIKLAIDEANEYFPSIGVNLQFQLNVEATGGNSNIALKKLQKLQKEGIDVIIGPNSSTVLYDLKNYANENDILLISPSSSAPNLQNESDNIIRFMISDDFQTKALANMIKKEAINYLIILVRNDYWGNSFYQSLINHINKFYPQLNNNIFVVKYDPEAKNFTKEIVKINNKLIKLKKRNIGIQLISYDEVIPICQTAITYPSFNNIKWFGSDTIFHIINQKNMKIINTINLFIPIFSNSSQNPHYYESTMKKIKKTIQKTPDHYALLAYDATWIVINAFAERTYKERLKEQIKESIITNANYYYGCTGWTYLNSKGDRIYGVFDLVKLGKINNNYQWIKYGEFLIDPQNPQGVLRLTKTK